MIYKNVASQKLGVYAYTASTGAAKTGDAAQITAYLSKDFGSATATNDTSPTELDATNMPGWYVFDLTQAETNAEVLVLAAKSSTSGVVCDQIQMLTQDAAISSRLAPTVAGRTLDVSAGGEAGIDWSNVGNPTTTVNLSGTSTKANETAPLDAAGTRSALGMAAANLDTQLDALPTAAEGATAVRSELAVELAHLDADVSSAGGGLTAQETANALGLTPAGTPATGSVYKRLIDMPATILTTAIAAYDDTPGTFGYLLSLLAGLDFTAVNLVAASNAGEITIKRTLTLAAVVSGLTIPADWTACYWTVKRSLDDADADALIQILVSNPPDAEDGLLALVGAAPDDSSAGSIVVNQALGTVTIALDDASSAALEDAVELVWDVKVHTATAKTQPGTGTATITTAVTRA